MVKEDTVSISRRYMITIATCGDTLYGICDLQLRNRNAIVQFSDTSEVTRCMVRFNKIFTARIRGMGKGNIFSLFTLAGGGGGGCTPSQVGGGVPHPGLDGEGGPHLRYEVGGGYPTSAPGLGVTPPTIQTWPGYPLGWGTPPDLG